MNLEEIKRYDDSVWLYILKQRTVFDTENIKAQKDWLIEKVEEFKEFQESVFSIIQLAHLDEQENAYKKAVERIENLVIDSWVKLDEKLRGS